MKIKVTVWFASSPLDEWEATIPDGLTKDQLDGLVRDAILSEGVYADVEDEITSWCWEAL